MISSNISAAWLCWTLVSGLRAVEAQDNGGGGSVPSTDGNANSGGGNGGFGNGSHRGGRRFGHQSGFRNGGRFGSGRNDGQQGGDQTATNDSSGEVDNKDTEGVLISSSPTTFFMPLETSAAPASITVETTALPEAKNGLHTASSRPTGSFGKPSSVVDMLSMLQSSPATLVGIPYVAPSISEIVQSLSSLSVPGPHSSLRPVSSLTTTRLTVTSSKTVYVNSTPLSFPESALAEANSSASTQATQAPSLDLAPLPTSSLKPFSGGEKAGVGIGITLAILVIVGAIAYEFHRRSKMKAHESLGSETGSQHEGSPPRRSVLTSAFTSFFGPHDKREQKGDPEWSIESAEKVSIVRAGSVKSVESQTRPITPPLPSLPLSGPRHAPSGSDTELLKVGMRVPERKPTPGLADMALRSNPPVSPGSFPSPPRAGKTGSWPLPE
ncbi:uncharacterized protein CC84DRAFT_1229351 [Paraphaeosphaeria sporulosa]|uniref:Mid2 domain-containing protein n=1 Tax=Paraphaeosphaeria sporulosa TaxID=1460663 RepID=A0A177C268_9PLEO|nr:uncharacterized protein CC84DRAFT_1229351 [Paraphaeosphaeria sporulosa]OAG00827.1 hypothetical protein CC84DRAFT_1229351 [Paraphaeosphaeria sporulosa]